MRALPVKSKSGEIYGYMIFCPACNTNHQFKVIAWPGPVWSFNGDIEYPTFRPSMLCNKDSDNPTVPRCHSYVTDGKIQYLEDCTHELKGQTIDLPEIE
jgi:hypothetical protein